MEMITGNGYPSKHLKGEVGQNYKDLTTGDVFECVSANEHSRINLHQTGGYIWKKVARGPHVEVCGAQPDWNQNDPTAADYVKNRTHYDEQTVKTLYNDVPDRKSGSYGSFVYDLGGDYEVPLNRDASYTVELNGVVHEMVLNAEHSVNGIVSFGLKNPTEYEFMLTDESKAEAHPNAVTYLTTMGVSVDEGPVVVVETSETIKKLDGKYLPDGLPYSEFGTTELFSGFISDPSISSGWANFTVADKGLIQMGSVYTVKLGSFEAVGCVPTTDGNNVYLGVNDDFPFEIVSHDNGTFFGVSSSWVSENIPDGDILTIIGPGEIVHKLDKKYLPDDRLDVIITQYVGSSSTSYKIDKTHAELMAAIEAAGGVHVINARFHISLNGMIIMYAPVLNVAIAADGSNDITFIVMNEGLLKIVCNSDGSALDVSRVE